MSHTGCVDVTEDHSLLTEDKNIINPTECNLKTKLLTNYPTEFDCNIDYQSSENISKDKAYIYGFFYGDGSCGKYKCQSGLKFSWALNNSDLNVLDKVKCLLIKTLKINVQERWGLALIDLIGRMAIQIVGFLTVQSLVLNKIK